MTWSEYVALWSKTTGHLAAFEKTTVAVHDKLAPGGYGEEIGEMYGYMQDFGYWAKDDTSVIFPHDVSFSSRERNVRTALTNLQLGVEIGATRIEDYIKNEDWSELINRPVPGS